MTEGFAGALADALETSWPGRPNRTSCRRRGIGMSGCCWLVAGQRQDQSAERMGQFPGDFWANLRLAIVGATAADVRDIMIEGESGILACAPAWASPTYNHRADE